MAPFPPTSYLIQGPSPRLRVLDERGRPDPRAVRHATMLLPVVPNLDDGARAAAGRALSRLAPIAAEKYLAKGAVAFGDAEDAGLLREVGNLTVMVERPKGSVRTGKAPDGSTWETTMQADYGFLPMTVCAGDNEEVDAYVGANLSAPMAYVVSQVHEDGSDDEPKLMLGFDSELDAVRCYLAHVPAWCFGGVSAIPVSLIGGLMGIEPSEATAALKSMSTSPAHPAAKAAVDTAAIADGGRALPTQVPELDPMKILGSIEQPTAKAMTSPKAIPMTAEMVGYFTEPEQVVPAIEPTDNRCPICAVEWTENDVRTYSRSLLASEGPNGWTSFYRTHGSCADAFPDDIVNLDAQMLRIVGEKDAGKEPSAMKKDWRVVASWQTNTKTALTAHVRKVQKRANAFSVVKGWWASTSHAGQVIPLDEAPPEIARAVTSMPITEPYPSPDDVGGWLGVIEPDDQAWVAFVAVDGRTLLWTQRDDDGAVAGVPFYTYRLDLATMPISEALSKSYRPIMKFRCSMLGQRSEDTYVQKDATGLNVGGKVKRRIVYGVVLEPEPCDGQGDSQSHTYDTDFVRDACHYYSQFRLLNADHKGPPIDPSRARVVEMYLAPVDFVLDTPRGPQNVKKGSWVMGTEILDDALWAKVESGEWQAYSIEGYSRSEPIDNTYWNVRQIACRQCSATWKASFQKDKSFPPVLACPRCHAMTPSALN